MIRKLILIGVTLTLIMPFVPLQAAEKYTPKLSKSGSSKQTASKQPSKKQVVAKHTVTSKRILVTIQADKKYQVQKASYNRENAFPNEDDNVTGMPRLASSKALIVNQETGEVLYAKNTDQSTPIASVTKLMTAMVMLDANLPMDELLSIDEADVDLLKGTSSRLRVGTVLTRGELLQLALMSSENRAASALGRNYPGGLRAFVIAMNTKALMLGMAHSRFVDSTGLNSNNVSTAADLVHMVRAAYQYPQIRQITTTGSQLVAVNGMRNPVSFVNTNILVRNSDWVIGLSKTGYISEAGRCLVMQAEIAGKPMIIVLLDSDGKLARIGDAQRIRKWIESSNVFKPYLG
ncbi:MAG: D-alanyl-D-alanine endopeptidase [Methylophilaceae bacterium]